jgi:hypothetical protein
MFMDAPIVAVCPPETVVRGAVCTGAEGAAGGAEGRIGSGCGRDWGSSLGLFHTDLFSSDELFF